MSLYQLFICPLSKHKTCSAVRSVAVRSLSIEYKQIENVNASQLQRGTGGRSSFNGYVATIFGATGFFGRTLCNRLGRIGTQLIIPYRCEGDDVELKSLKLCGDLGQVLFQPFDLKDPNSIKKAVKYSNIVINLIGRDFETKNFSFEDIHVTGPREIAKACRECGVERLIHFSSLNVTETPEQYVYKLIMRKPYLYLSTKLKGERAVLEEFPDATIFRPAVIYGLNDRFLAVLSDRKRVSNASIPLWKSGEHTIRQPVHMSDLAKGVIAAMKDRTTKGKIYQGVGPERFYLSDIVDWCNQIVLRSKYWTGKGRHEIRLDPLYIATVLISRFGMGRATHLPRHNRCLEQIERESVTDTVLRELPTLEDLGVELTRWEDQAPGDLWEYTMHGFYLREYHEFDLEVPLKQAVEQNETVFT